MPVNSIQSISAGKSCKLEQQASTSHQTTVAAGLPTVSHCGSMPQENQNHPPIALQIFNSWLAPQVSSARTVSNTLSASNNCTCGVSQQGITVSGTHRSVPAIQDDGLVPSLENLRRLPNISQAQYNPRKSCKFYNEGGVDNDFYCKYHMLHNIELVCNSDFDN